MRRIDIDDFVSPATAMRPRHIDRGCAVCILSQHGGIRQDAVGERCLCIVPNIVWAFPDDGVVRQDAINNEIKVAGRPSGCWITCFIRYLLQLICIETVGWRR